MIKYFYYVICKYKILSAYQNDRLIVPSLQPETLSGILSVFSFPDFEIQTGQPFLLFMEF